MHLNNGDIAAGDGGKLWLFYSWVRFKPPGWLDCSLDCEQSLIFLCKVIARET